MLALILCVLWISGAARAAGVPEWQSDWGEETCSLLRIPDQDEAIVLAIRRAPGSERTVVALLSDRWASAAAEDAPGVTLSLDPGGTLPAEAYYVPLGRRGPELALRVTGRAFLDRLASAATLTVSQDGVILATYSLPHAAAAIRSLRDCERSALVERGIDYESWAALRSGPVASVDLGEMVMNSDLPIAAYRGGNGSARLVVRLAVDASGKPSDCAVIRKTERFALDSRICQLFLRKARFDPAIDDGGAAVAAPFTTDIRIYVGP
jgi:hypothetical protein